MKYSEFIREVEKMGLNTTTVNGCVEVLNKYGEMLLYVDMDYDFSISTEYTSFDELDFDELDKEIKKKLFNLAVELASTPLDEREDEKRYRLRLPFITDHRAYLNGFRNGFFVGNKSNVNKHKTKIIFTESEIEELKRKHNLDSFVLEEVKEDE